MNAPWSPNKRSGGIAPRDAFTAFVCDEATAEMIRPVAVELGWSGEKINKGGLRNAVQTLSVSSSPHVLLVDLTESGDPINDINALAEVCEPGTIVIATGTINDVQLYRELLASGIQDYLLKPLSADHIREALLQAQAVLHGPKNHGPDVDRPRMTVAVIGARGGSGSSAIATSLAWQLAEKQTRSTALLDLDVHFGTGALAFDLEPGRGLTDALENPSRIDGLFIERAMVRATEKLAVLSAEAPINQPLLADPHALFHLQEEMKNAFESVIVDLPRAVAVQNAHLLTDMQNIVIVTEQTLAATRDTIRLLGFLRSNAPNAKLTIVSNRVTATPPPEVSRKDFEASIERKIDIIVPFDPKLATTAAKQGKCLAEVAKGSKVGSALDQLMGQLLNNIEEAADEAGSKSLMGKLVDLKGMLASKGKAKAAGARK